LEAMGTDDGPNVRCYYHLAGARARAGRVWRGPDGLARRAEKEREASWALGWTLGWWLLLG
jgi:hypothetical protein